MSLSPDAERVCADLVSLGAVEHVEVPLWMMLVVLTATPHEDAPTEERTPTHAAR